jgi:membrane-associated phospholipid phosphatase
MQVVTSIGRSAKYIVSAAVILTLVTSESPVAFYYVTAAVVTSLVGKIIKQIAKQPRPEKSPKKGFGMPSSHTGAITFFATVVFFKSHLFLPNPIHRILLNGLLTLYSLLAW